MTSALFFPTAPRWHIWTALSCALAAHLAAIALARNHPVDATVLCDGLPITDVVGVDLAEATSELPDIAQPPEEMISRDVDEMFHDDVAPIAKFRPRKFKATPPSLKRIGPPLHPGSFKMVASSAPRPEYPYEARRRRITGSGTAALTIDSNRGDVSDVRMSQSTGSAILDNATISALRRWRFKPGAVTNVQVPITFTLTGAVY